MDLSSYQYDPLVEKITNSICAKLGTSEKGFFRNHATYYLATLAGMMRVNYQIPGFDPEPANVFAINLAPSGFGKGFSTLLIENRVIKEFYHEYMNVLFPYFTETGLEQLSVDRCTRKGSDPDTEKLSVEKEFSSLGPMLTSFDSATIPAIKQHRQILLMAQSGALNFQVDEIGANLLQSSEVLKLFLELYSGFTKTKLVKHTAESLRNEPIVGCTPANMMLFGVPSALLDGGKTEEELNSLLNMGYARRALFSFIPDDFNEQQSLIDPVSRLEAAKLGKADTELEEISRHLKQLATTAMHGIQLEVPDYSAIMYFEYQNYCAVRSSGMKEFEHIAKAEMKQRFFKAGKIAAVYAFCNQSTTIEEEHIRSAIALCEASGKDLNKILKRDRPYVKLAKHLGKIVEGVTQTDLIEDLPYFRGSKSYREDLLTQAIDWGYRHNILIKRKYEKSIQILSGETLEATDTDNLILSYSQGLSEGYSNDIGVWDQLHEFCTLDNYHWINHHLVGSHRVEDSCKPGFNLVVLDIDNGTNVSAALKLLEGYKTFIYTTKRHADDHHRFRIVMPTNYVLKLDQETYVEFMKNLYEWLPFDSDTQTGQRARKWMTNDGEYNYTEGQLLDVLPFIPSTVRSEEFKQRALEHHDLDNLERWFISHTGSGNRNNNLLRYAMLRVDAGYQYKAIKAALRGLNEKIDQPLSETELDTTVLRTVRKKIKKLK